MSRQFRWGLVLFGILGACTPATDSLPTDGNPVVEGVPEYRTERTQGIGIAPSSRSRLAEAGIDVNVLDLVLFELDSAGRARLAGAISNAPGWGISARPGTRASRLIDSAFRHVPGYLRINKDAAH